MSLDYKAAGSLDRTNPKTAIEVTKDVSAFANSSGGVLIYGVGESPANRHLPGELDPIRRSDVSKEWLESIILNIQPRIDGIKIHPLPMDDERVLYVIEIPQSTTAHQARDNKYYKRWNFSSHPMEDYEIRDVMNRTKHPRILLTFEIDRYIWQDPLGMPRALNREREEVVSLNVYGENKGLILAEYVFARVFVPVVLVDPDGLDQRELELLKDAPETATFLLDNKKQNRTPLGKAEGGVRFEPILPSLNVFLGSCRLNRDTLLTEKHDAEILWQVHADNALRVDGKTRLGDIHVKDRRRD